MLNISHQVFIPHHNMTGTILESKIYKVFISKDFIF